MRVLIVDDNHDVAEIITELVRLAGHEVRAAPDGPTALVVAEEFRPDVILLDIGLPGMSGLEVARRLRAMASLAGVRIVAMTGSAAEDATQAAGFDDYLMKPADVGDLERVLAGA